MPRYRRVARRRVRRRRLRRRWRWRRGPGILFCGMIFFVIFILILIFALPLIGVGVPIAIIRVWRLWCWIIFGIILLSAIIIAIVYFSGNKSGDLDSDSDSDSQTNNISNTENIQELFCSKCGKKIPADAKFCDYCGEKQ